AERHHARRRERDEVARHEHARVAERAARDVASTALVHHGHLVALGRGVVGRAEAHDPRAHHPDTAAHAAGGKAPPQGAPPSKGARWWRRRVASPVTWAVPVISGTTRPAAALSRRKRPSKTLPMTLSWRHTAPGASLPSASRQASFALVPVPQGERS